MGRIFDALQRDQQTQTNGRRDPLAEATRSPELAADQHVELPEMIGAPVTPQSNQGGVLSYLREDFLNGELPQRVADDEAIFSQEDAVHSDARLTPGVSNGAVQAKSDGAQKLYPLGVQSKYRLPETVEPRVALSLNLDPARVHPRLIAVTEPHSIVSEQYRTLRTQIFHEAERRLTQVVVVTSAIAGEGKTSTSLNLSWTIANSKGRRVLLIDSDMRRPSIASYLGIAPSVGFCEVLAGDCELMAPVIRVYGRSPDPDLDEDYQLFVLPVKGEARNPTELLSGSSLPDVINAYRRYFDFIIIDSPPVTPFADARLLANQSDGALVVIRSGAAPYSTVERAIEALSPARMLGVVLNGAKEDEDDGYYYEYYYTEEKRSQRLPFGLSKIAERLGLFGRGASQQSSLTDGNPASSGKAGADEK